MVSKEPKYFYLVFKIKTFKVSGVWMKMYKYLNVRITYQYYFLYVCSQSIQYGEEN